MAFRLYYYQPSSAAAIIFAILFTAATLAHFFRLVKGRTWYMIPFMIGCIFEMIGYDARAVSASENPGPYELAPYIAQSVLLLVAPALFAASTYMELGRIVIMIRGEEALVIRRTWTTKIFVVGDIISFLVQAMGAGLLSSGSTNANNETLGKDILVAGLFFQIFFFGLFVITATIFHRRINSAPTPLSLERPWKKHMAALYTVSGLIFVRSIVRCVEFIMGYSGYIATHEAFLYVFDGLPMFLVTVTMIVIHPSQVAKFVRQMRMDEKKAKEAGTDMGDWQAHSV